jgi:peptidoglycan/LPS O-acetylase OafA/YrhL
VSNKRLETISLSNPEHPERRRYIGLDTLRACAILLVFAHHYSVFVSGEPSLSWFSSEGWLGVDLFFVLSGYLVGNPLFAARTAGRRNSVLVFYARRLLRTWPAFAVVLAAYFLLPGILGGQTPPPLYRFLTFTQNIGLHPGTAFSHAWSLCVEEQFYLALPLLAAIALGRSGGPARPWLCLGGLELVAIGYRWFMWSRYAGADAAASGDYHLHIYYHTLGRFDEFLPGLAVALVRQRHPGLWAALLQRGRGLFWLGCVATSCVFYAFHSFHYVDGLGYGFVMTVFGYAFGAIAFGVLMASALSGHSPLARVAVPGFRQLAVLSYSVYLTHKAVAHVVQRYLLPDTVAPWLLLLAVGVASLAVGCALYVAVERPFMRLRDRLLPA